MPISEPLIIRTQLSNIPLLRDRYPFLYLEHGKLSIDDSSVKWLSADGNHFRLPIATISTLLLGPGTSVTSPAMEILASLNVTVCWVGEDSLIFYAVGHSPTANTYNLKHQLALAANPEKSLRIAQKMYAKRFPDLNVYDKTLKTLMPLEGQRVQKLYAALADKYRVGWTGRSYTPGQFELSDTTNKLITSINSYLYALICSILYSLGLEPRIGFIHSGSPLPFVYDIADLYKEEVSFDLAFSLTRELGPNFSRLRVIEAVKSRLLEIKFMSQCPKDVLELLELKGEK